VAYTKLSKWKEASDALKESVKLRPAHASSRYMLGLCYLTMGDKPLAMEQAEALKSLDQNLANQLLALAQK
jgi:tetratricopeptide (TPR) repeat protein